MSMSYPQQPAGQPAVPAQPAQAAQPVQQVVSQPGRPRSLHIRGLLRAMRPCLRDPWFRR